MGAILNAAGILLGGSFGLLRTLPLSAATQGFFKMSLGVLTMFFGLRLTWLSVNGTFGQAVKQIVIACAPSFSATCSGNCCGCKNSPTGWANPPAV